MEKFEVVSQLLTKKIQEWEGKYFWAPFGVCVWMVILMCTYMNVHTHLQTFKFCHFLVNQTYLSSFFKCLDFLLHWQWVASVQGKTLATEYGKDI